MRSGLKIALTFLISIVATAVFAYLAFIGGPLEGVISDFYRERAGQDQRIRLQEAGNAVVEWHEKNIARFGDLARLRPFQTSFSTRLNDELIDGVETASASLADNLDGFVSLRIVDDAGDIHFSTLRRDIINEVPGVRRSYQNWDPEQEVVVLPLGETVRDVPWIVHDENDQRFHYLTPLEDRAGTLRGWIIVTVSRVGLEAELAAADLSALGGTFWIVGTGGIVIDLRPEQAEKLAEASVSIWPDNGEFEKNRFLALAEGAPGETNENESYELITERFVLESGENDFLVGRIIPGNLLRISPLVRALVIVALFITLTLLVYLLLNIRQDREEILRSRIRRLQIGMLKDWLAVNDEAKSRLRARDLENRREEVRRELRKGLGRLKGKRADEADTLIDQGWDEIVEVIAKRDVESSEKSETATGGAVSASDLKRIEDMITRAVADIKISIPAGSIPAAPAAPAPTPGRPIDVEVVEDAPAEIGAGMKPVEVEEITEDVDADTVDEIVPLAEEAGEGAIGAGMRPVEVEEITEEEYLDGVGATEAEEVPDDSTPATEGMRPVEVEVLDEEEGDLEELSEVVTAEEVPPAEPVEALPDEVPIGAGMRPVEVEVLSEENEEIAELAEIEEIPEAEEVEEFAEIEEIPEAEEVEEFAEIEEVPEAEEIPEAREIPEVPSVEEISVIGAGMRPVDVEVLSEDDGEIEELAEIDEAEVVAEAEEIPEIEEVEIVAESEEIPETDEVEIVAESEEIPETDEMEVVAKAEKIPEVLDEAESTLPIGAGMQPVDVEVLSDDEEDVADLSEFEEVVDEGGILAPADSEAVPEIVETAEELTLEKMKDLQEQETDSIAPDVAETADETLEALPLAVTEDTQDLVEIDQTDKDRIYMFDEEFDAKGEIRKSAEKEGELEEVEELEELEEVEEVEEIAEAIPVEEEIAEALPVLDEADGTDDLGGDTTLTWDLEEILAQVTIQPPSTPEELEELDGDTEDSERLTMASLIKTRTSGLLPKSESFDEELEFVDHTTNLEWAIDGLDYDRYLYGFKRGATGVYKSLMSVTKEYGALCGVLYLGSSQGMETDYAVGLDDESASRLSMEKNDPVWDEWFGPRSIVFVPNLRSSIIGERTRHSEFRFVKSGLFLPIIYGGNPSYLFLGFKERPADPLALVLGRKVSK